MNQIIRQLFLILFTIGVIGCQNESPEMEMTPGQDESQSPSAQDPFQQPSVDTDVSDSELDVFVEAINRAQEIQMNSQQDMMEIIEDEGIDVETYNEIAAARQMGQAGDENASSEDLQRFESASERIDEVGQQVEEEMSAAIEDAGMDVERFQEINMAIQQDPSLQQRVQEEMQQGMMAPPPNQP